MSLNSASQDTISTDAPLRRLSAKALRPVADPIAPPYVARFQRVDSYAEIQEIMRSPDFLQGASEERSQFFGDTLIMIDGEEHLERKRMLSPLFSREAMEYYESHLLDPTIDEVMKELFAQKGVNGVVHADLVPLIRAMLHRISARIAGVDGIDTPARTERFCGLVEKLGQAVTVQFTTGDMQEVIKAGFATLQQLVQEFLQVSLDRRRELVKRFHAGEIKKAELPRDVLTMICLHGTDVQAGDKPFHAYVWRECALFLHASTANTVQTIPHVILHLDEWLAAYPDEISKVTDAAFLRMAIGESLRLHQASPVRFRTAGKDVTLSTGRKVVKGETLALYAPPANVETKVFGADARMFNPYRETPPGLQPWGLTFGSGIHMCIGRTLVTGDFKRNDDQAGTDGTMVKILKTLYAHGLECDPANPPKRVTSTYHDAYASVPIILRKRAA